MRIVINGSLCFNIHPMIKEPLPFVKLSKNPSTKKGPSLNKEIEDLISRKKKIICKALNRRPVFFDKYIETTKKRRDKTRRKQKLPPALELIAKARKGDIRSRVSQKGMCYEIKGVTGNGIEITVHIREEIVNKNKMLYLISTF